MRPLRFPHGLTKSNCHVGGYLGVCWWSCSPNKGKPNYDYKYRPNTICARYLNMKCGVERDNSSEALTSDGFFTVAQVNQHLWP